MLYSRANSIARLINNIIIIHTSYICICLRSLVPPQHHGHSGRWHGRGLAHAQAPVRLDTVLPGRPDVVRGRRQGRGAVEELLQAVQPDRVGGHHCDDRSDRRHSVLHQSLGRPTREHAVDAAVQFVHQSGPDDHLRTVQVERALHVSVLPVLRPDIQLGISQFSGERAVESQAKAAGGQCGSGGGERFRVQRRQGAAEPLRGRRCGTI